MNFTILLAGKRTCFTPILKLNLFVSEMNSENPFRKCDCHCNCVIVMIFSGDVIGVECPVVYTVLHEKWLRYCQHCLCNARWLFLSVSLSLSLYLSSSFYLFVSLYLYFSPSPYVFKNISLSLMPRRCLIAAKTTARKYSPCTRW